jgi:DNA repair protein SbcC/Rad50
MVPVRLKLRNFLSYGEDAEPLDFGAFHVACLSGGNGQGKSALLDAMTWAIWGQARKSSDARKPDEQLLRVGAREMEVDFTFDLEGRRYRIVRSYYRTVTGKTTKPGLEFQVDDGSGTWRALSGTSVAETQDAIDKAIRLDYDTFINSAFLLQGRSDEFTKKRPSERKQILAKILGLDRFALLEKAARAKHAEAEAVHSAAVSEMERLQEALGQERVWREEMEVAERAIVTKASAVQGLRASLTAVAESIAALDMIADHIEEQKRRLLGLIERHTKSGSERERLAQRITQAQRLLERADEIRADYDRFCELDAQRTSLDEKRELQQRLEAEELELREKLQQRWHDHLTKLSRLDAEQVADDKTCDELRSRLQARPGMEVSLREAEEAARELTRLKETQKQRRLLHTRMEGLEMRIAHERGMLKARAEGLRSRLMSLRKTVERIEGLRQQCQALRKVLARVPELQDQLSHLHNQGTATAGELAVAQREETRSQELIDAIDKRLKRLDTVETEACPTCGTTLTKEHRREVRQAYENERSAYVEQRRDARSKVAALGQARHDIGARYRCVKSEIDKLQSQESDLGGLEAQLESAEGDQVELRENELVLGALDERLQRDDISPPLSAELSRLSDALSDLPWDEAHFESVASRAAQTVRYQAELRRLEEDAERLELVEASVARRAKELTSLRALVATGGPDSGLDAQLRRVEAEIASLGYDGPRHDEIRRKVTALRDAPKRFVELGHVLNNVAEWKERRAELAEELVRLDADQAALRAEIGAARARLAARPTRMAERDVLASELADVEAQLRELHAERGALQARLEQCAKDRERMADVRNLQGEARRERVLYDHLRRAFGRNGIPALMIEQTVPEVEERANALLERLCGGRVRVHLETLRDKKAGGTRETLDIRITDEHGIARSYETFSGGEAFRVNFALRIAIAQLLADRAGVRIRTLVVDEGFGTQDKQGIEAMVESLHAVRQDFEKVLVITHLEEMKEAFPVRIEVEKDPVMGSIYQVVGV